MEQSPEVRVEFDEFLRRLGDSEPKLEFYDGTVVEIPSATVAHSCLLVRLVDIVRARSPAGCTTLMTGMVVWVAASRAYVFPDIVSTYEHAEPDATTLLAPALVIEVLTTESERRDRIEKFDVYQSMESLQEYVIVDSRVPRVLRYRRSGLQWEQREFAKPRDVVALASVPLTFRLSDIYDDLDLKRSTTSKPSC